MTGDLLRSRSVTPWLLHVRARGLLWAVPGSLTTVLLAAAGGSWIAGFHWFDHWGRVPAVTVGALLVAILATSTLHHTDEEVQGSTPTPSAVAEVAVVLTIVALCAAVAVITIPEHLLERGGLEMVRNLAGLTGLALLGNALVGTRLGWLLPFSYTGVSYFTVARSYQDNPVQAVPAWIMFPATWPITHLTAA